MANTRKPVHFIQALAKGMAVLGCFTADRQYLTLQNIADLTGFNKVGTQRITDTLTTLGYLGRNRHKEFFLEPKILTLGFSYLNASKLYRIGRTHIKKFGERIGRTTNLGLLDDLDVVFLYRYEAAKVFKYDIREGSRMPSYCSALGKILMAFLDPAEFEKRLNRLVLEPVTSFTITDRQTFKDEIELTRKRGFAIGNRELNAALYTVAVPLFDIDNETAAAVAISFSIDEVGSKLVLKAVKELFQEGQRLSGLLGYKGDYPTPTSYEGLPKP